MQQMVSVSGDSGDDAACDAPLAAPDGGAVDLAFMHAARAEAALAAAAGEVPVGALVVRGGEVVARAGNRRERDQDPCGHAELIAIRAAAQALGTWRLDECVVYVTLEPCPMCAGAMVLARVQRCVFGCADPKGGFLGTLADLSRFPGLNHRFAVTGGVDAEACQAQLRTFFRDLRAAKRRAARPPSPSPDGQG